MSSLLLIAVIAFGAIGLVGWLVGSIIDAAETGRRQAEQQRRQAKKKRKKKKLENRRRKEEAIKIVGERAPELAAVRQAITVLRDYAASANAYRPKFITHASDISFREVRFTFPLDVIFPRNWECSDDGPDPEPWVTTIDNLFVPVPYSLRQVYEKSLQPHTFPCSAPTLSFDPTPPPQYPRVELPPSEIKFDSGKKFRERLRNLFTLELSQGWKLKHA